MIRYAAVTTAGVCEKNDDRVMVNGETISSGKIEGVADNGILATVCDGVGGYAHGDVAAEITSSVFLSLVGVTLSESEIRSAFVDANYGVMRKQASDTEYRNMATTVAGVFISVDDIISFNVGDSKILRFRSPYLMQLSTDHISAKGSSTLTSFVGDEQRCNPKIVVGENRVFQNDIYIICSDGLSDVVSIGEMENALASSNDPPSKRDALLNTAINNCSQDNISIVILEVV